MRIIFLEVVGEPEGNDGKSGVVVGTGFLLCSEDGFFRAFEAMLPFFAMNIAYANIPSTGLESFAQESCVFQAIFHNASEAVKAKMDKIVVLCDDLGAWAGEIECVRFLGAS